jgi:hypothetical protein
MRAGSLTSAQIRAARALLRWNAVELARASAVGVNTVRRAELAEAKTSLTAANELAIRRAFEEAGVEFTNGDQPGVRLAKPAAARSTEYADRADSVTPDKIAKVRTRPQRK